MIGYSFVGRIVCWGKSADCLRVNLTSPLSCCVAEASDLISLCFSFRDVSEFLTYWVVEKLNLSVCIVLSHRKRSVVVVYHSVGTGRI